MPPPLHWSSKSKSPPICLYELTLVDLSRDPDPAIHVRLRTVNWRRIRSSSLVASRSSPPGRTLRPVSPPPSLSPLSHNAARGRHFPSKPANGQSVKLHCALHNSVHPTARHARVLARQLPRRTRAFRRPAPSRYPQGPGVPAPVPEDVPCDRGRPVSCGIGEIDMVD